QPPRVWAVNAARTETRCSGVRWNAAARTVPHGSRGVTGLSEPKARGTPARSRAAKGFRVRARSAPSRRAYMPSSPPHRASKAGWTDAVSPSSANAATVSGVSISACSTRCRAARIRARPSLSAAARTPSVGADGGVAHVVACTEAGLQAGFHAIGDDMGGDGLGVQVGGAGVGGVGVGLVQAGGVRAEGAVGEQVTGGADGPELPRAGHVLLGPVADDARHVVLGGEPEQAGEVVLGGDLGA